MKQQKEKLIVIIGGSNAGLSAALTLGRSRRKVLVIDAGHARNEHARNAYGFYTRDKTPPAELVRIGREQLCQYDVAFKRGKVVKAKANGDRFTLTLDGGKTIDADKLLLAHGIADDFSFLPGLEKLWGKSAFSCPYCDGWEIRDQPLIVVGSGDEGYALALTMHHWSKDIILCTNKGIEPFKKAHLRKLQRYGIRVIDDIITQFTQKSGQLKKVHFKNTPPVERFALFAHPPCHLGSDLAAQLGCRFIREGTKIRVDAASRTDISGVYAAGDIASKHSHIVTAAASGALAAMTINHDLLQETYR